MVKRLARLVDLDEQVEAAGLPFALIDNSVTGGQTSNPLFHDDTVAFVEAYQQAGGSPTIRHVESWYSDPEAMLHTRCRAPGRPSQDSPACGDPLPLWCYQALASLRRSKT